MAADIDIAGVLRVRVNGDAKGLPVVSRQLGLDSQSADLDVAADIYVDFETLARPPRLRHLGLDYAACDDSHFYVLDRAGGGIAMVLPFEQLGHGLHLRCSLSVAEVPLLAELLTFVAMTKGYAAMHATAFRYEGRCALVTGWAQSGKTEALLAFMNEGAEYLGDEVVLVAGDGSHMVGLPVPITLRDWHLDEMTRHRPALDARSKLIFGGTAALRRLYAFSSRTPLGRSLPVRLLGEVSRVLGRRARFARPAQAMFGSAIAAGTAPIHAAFLIGSADGPRTEVEAITVAELSAAAHHSNTYERSYLLQYYAAWRFAFPGRSNPLIDAIESTQEAVLEPSLAAALEDTGVWRVTHPYPVSFSALFEAMRPALTESTD